MTMTPRRAIIAVLVLVVVWGLVMLFFVIGHGSGAGAAA
jgi:hypothetical protein